MVKRVLLLPGLMLGICLISLPSWAQVTIFNASPTASGGEALSVQGQFGAGAKVYGAPGAATAGQLLPVLVQGEGQATVQVPAALGRDVFRVWVEDQGQRSPGVFVNQAWGMHYDSPDVVPGGSLRLFGRNLLLPGATAQVRFAPRNGGGGGGVATIKTGASSAYVLSLDVPASLLPGTTYDVFVSNGGGGSAGETRVELPVTAIAPGTDYFALGVPWAAKFNFHANRYDVRTDSRLALKARGDGTTNDQPAIQAAIDRASADGGGVVVIPAGTYKLVISSDGALNMRSRVVVQGAGKDQTTLKFGYGTAASNRWGVLWSGAKQAGLADLTLQNVNESGKWINNLTGSGSEIFMQRMRFDLNTGDWLWLANSDKLAVTNSEFVQGIDNLSGYHGPVQFNGTTNFVVARNRFTYAVDGLNFNHAHEGVFEDNQVFRDGSARYPTSLVNHVLVVNFAQNLAVLNNLFRVINGPSQNSNDGETIIAEGGGPDRIDEDTGTASGATATTLQDNSKNWGTFRQQPVVAIVNGKGMGQWRRIVSRSGGTLQLDRAWDVLPVAGSRYAIFNWGARNWLVQGNTLEGNRRGITLYHNATDNVAIVGNTLTNSGSIDLTPLQQQQPGAPQQFVPTYNTQIVGNTVANIDGANGVFIGVHTVQFVQSKTFGTSVIGLEVRRNVLRAHQPNVPAVVDALFPEGYLNYLQFQQGSEKYVDEQIPSVLGSIFQNNQAINCDRAVYLNTGSYNTLVCNTELVNVPQLFSDDVLNGATHASVRTVDCPAGAPNQPPVADPKTNDAVRPNAPAVPLVPLSGSDPSGTINSFTLNSLPPPSQGRLFLAGKPAQSSAKVLAAQANQLSFEAVAGFEGDAVFTYSATSTTGLTSTAVPFTVPVRRPLPVVLVNFTATPAYPRALLRWTTATEENNSHFEVERSLDGVKFQRIGRVAGHGTTAEAQQYTYPDNMNPPPAQVLYYRLRQVDKDGSGTYSPVAAVTFRTPVAAPTVLLYPNPVTTVLNVALSGMELGGRLVVVALSGQVLLEKVITAPETALDVQQLPAGTYSLLVYPLHGKRLQRLFTKH
ncbi:hypothetical protein CDA63_16710 [Hymenobacter amundsenii]|uniref:Rhamnogalacturonase A/B/Epimerase-like pectate lyase domain-containing protein n=2 Tax=Hymenobacter amundsenii TaxID=2006685 RepID=A0A246FHD1_9BACT|nr:hypothetical protein CDA63_16710 [Hymenobacter amundsenii]